METNKLRPGERANIVVASSKVLSVIWTLWLTSEETSSSEDRGDPYFTTCGGP